MGSQSESSLPTEVTQTVRSSPPIATPYSLPPMDDPNSRSEPAAPQEQQQPPDVEMPQRLKPKRVNSDRPERPTSAQRDRRDRSVEHSDVEAERDLSDEDADPADPIVEFDWQDLHEKYHAAIKQCSQEEAELMNEWSSLMEYFQVWAASGHEHETDRTFQRLRTRTLYVQNEEDDLDRTRLHYINVVKAFESALNLLKASGAMYRG